LFAERTVESGFGLIADEVDTQLKKQMRRFMVADTAETHKAK
jgi:hypothetical protein